MQVCLVRHAIAVERGATGVPDDARPLTARGRKRMEQAAAGLAILVRPDLVLSSPLLRAVQTAEILVAAFGLRGFIRSDTLADGDNDRLFTEIAKTAARMAVAVGHEPYMSGTLSYALTGQVGTINSEFKKGGAALISFETRPRAAAGTLEWLLPPGALRALARG